MIYADFSCSHVLRICRSKKPQYYDPIKTSLMYLNYLGYLNFRSIEIANIIIVMIVLISKWIKSGDPDCDSVSRKVWNRNTFRLNLNLIFSFHSHFLFYISSIVKRIESNETDGILFLKIWTDSWSGCEGAWQGQPHRWFHQKWHHHWHHHRDHQ